MGPRLHAQRRQRPHQVSYSLLLELPGRRRRSPRHSRRQLRPRLRAQRRQRLHQVRHVLRLELPGRRRCQPRHRRHQLRLRESVGCSPDKMMLLIRVSSSESPVPARRAGAGGRHVTRRFLTVVHRH